jgi:hypothetical protein
VSEELGAPTMSVVRPLIQYCPGIVHARAMHFQHFAGIQLFSIGNVKIQKMPNLGDVLSAKLRYKYTTSWWALVPWFRLRPEDQNYRMAVY